MEKAEKIITIVLEFGAFITLGMYFIGTILGLFFNGSEVSSDFLIIIDFLITIFLYNIYKWNESKK